MRRAVLSLVVLLGAMVLQFPCRAAPLSNPAVDRYNVHLGTQTFAGLYQFTTNTMLTETAGAIRGLGSDTIKLYLGSNYPRQYQYSLSSRVTNLLTLVRDDASCRGVFDSPFRNIIAWAYPFSNPDAPFGDGKYTATEQSNDYRELYDLTRYLLTNYNNSGKTFYLGHWEGDGYLNVNNWSTNPNPAVVAGMVAWENNRQKAVDDAKADSSFSNVQVYYYAEVNRVRDAMLNGPTNNQRVINMVVPYVTNLDFISYSSYDAMDLNSSDLFTTLNYIKGKLPAGKLAAGLGQRIWIGEYGWGGWSTAAQEPANRAYLQRLLPWGPRFILFWEIYNNEPNREFCLIDSNGVQVPSYYLHQRFINRARLEVARFQEANARLPSDAEFASSMVPLLTQPLAPPVSLSIADLSAQRQGTTATVAGRIAQGIYGDDQASIWVFWGRQDGGKVRANWEHSRNLGINTNFNPAVFSATLDSLIPQTNYYFQFYATNASGEAWAPTSGGFTTQTLDPGEYGSRMKILLTGYGPDGTVADSPILVELGTNFTGFRYDQFASSVGGDLRFTAADGTSLLAHEVDEWNTNGTSFVWVQVPPASETNNFIWAYWGNPLAATPPAGMSSRTWLPKYQAVWHLEQNGFPYADSARGTAITAGVMPVSVKGLAGQAASFDGSRQYLDAGVLDFGDSFTLSAWVKLDPAAAGIQTLFANKKGGWNTDGFALYVNSYLTTDRKLLFETGNGTSGQLAATGSNLVTAAVWHFVAAVVNKTAASVRLFIDGVDQTQSGLLQADFNSAADVNLGRFTDGSSYLRGALDEARVASGVTTASALASQWLTLGQNASASTYDPVTSFRPSLSLSVIGGSLVADWSARSVGSVLFSATNLGPGTLWSEVTNVPTLIGGQWELVLPASTNDTRFFRLEMP